MDIEELEEIIAEGQCYVTCPECGAGYTLEPDGWADCCGQRVESPLLAMGLI